MTGRILLQDLVTGSYLDPEGDWSSSCQQARVFEHTYLALQEGLNHRDKHTQVVWCFQNPSANLYMPVHPGEEHSVFPCDICPLAYRPADGKQHNQMI